MASDQTKTFSQVRGRTLRLGFVPLNDCAPIVMAHEKGFFAAHGLRVSLHRELGWATVRDKIIYRELDAAHALAAMPLAATLGLGSVRTDCLTGIVLTLNGNAITLSERLWKRGVRSGDALREEIRRLRHERMFTFGVVNRFSSHQHLLQSWFSSHGIVEREVRIVILPPSQMETNLSRGNLDGFCVGEPWNSVAANAGSGWIVSTSEQIEPRHPEKVLMVRSDFAEKHEEEHLALISALHQACAFCDDPINADEIAATLGRPAYVGARVEAIRAGLNGNFHFGHKEVQRLENFCVFHRHAANEPTLERAMWAIKVVRGTGACEEPSALNTQLASRVFRADLYQRATAEGGRRFNQSHENESELTPA